VGGDTVRPALSVIVAGGTLGERGRFSQALERQTLPSSQLEVLTAAPGVSAGEGWNDAAARAQGEVLVFTHADFVPTLDFAQTLLTLQRKAPGMVAVGRMSRDPGRTALTGYAATQWRTDRLSTFSADGLPPHATIGAPLAIARERFHAVEGFGRGLTWGDELEFVLRLIRRGDRVEHTGAPIGTRPAFRDDAAVLSRMEADGRGSVMLYGHLPASLPHLELGSYTAAGQRAVRLRDRLLALGVRSQWLSALGPVLGLSRQERWLRFVLSYAYWRGVWGELPDVETRRRLQHPPVVLMYHAVGDRTDPAGRYTIPATRFAKQLRWLRRQGYRAVRLEEILADRRQFRLPPARAVAITFDDGYEDNHRLAFPLLREAGMPATFFLVSARLGEANTWDAEGELAGRPLLGVDQAREMQGAGMELGAHTRHHPALSDIAEASLDDEIAGSHADLEQALGMRASSFAYPYGKMSPAASAAVERAGFLGAVCSRSGFNDPAAPDYALRRVEVRGTDSLTAFARAVRRGHRRASTR
jgi:peptidoglycan/xylan/chitin deacetylase (PgdA/CDA1 family)